MEEKPKGSTKAKTMEKGRTPAVANQQDPASFATSRRIKLQNFWRQQNKQVRKVVEEEAPTSTTSPTSATRPTSGTTTTKSVQLVTLEDGNEMLVYDISETAASRIICAVAVKTLKELRQNLVIHDSGADITVLPGNLPRRRAKQSDQKIFLRDACGNHMGNYGRCYVDFIVKGMDDQCESRSMKMRDKGMVSGVKAPLLALGRLLQTGWEVRHHQGQAALFREGKYVPLVYKLKGNSLAFEA